MEDLYDKKDDHKRETVNNEIFFLPPVLLPLFILLTLSILFRPLLMSCIFLLFLILLLPGSEELHPITSMGRPEGSNTRALS